MSLYLLGMDSVPDPVYNISGIIDDNYLVYCTNFSPDEIQTLSVNLLVQGRTRNWLLSESPSTLDFPPV